MNSISADAATSIMAGNGAVDVNNDLFIGMDGSIHDRHDRFPPIYGHMAGSETASAVGPAIETYNAMASVGWNASAQPAAGERLRITEDGDIAVRAIGTDGMPFTRRIVRVRNGRPAA